MSVAAVILEQNRAMLLSDGLVINVEGADPDNFKITSETIHDTGTSKIGKITDQMGVMWMGSGSLLLEKFLRETTATTLYQAADQLKALIARELDLGILMKHRWFNVNCHIVGFDETGFRMIQVATKNAQITCKSSKVMRGRQIFCLNPFIKKHPGIPQGTQATAMLYEAILEAGDTIQGFTNFVNNTIDFESTIFSLTLKKNDMFFNDQTLFSEDNEDTFGGSGLYINAPLNRLSLGDKLLFDNGDLTVENAFVKGEIEADTGYLGTLNILGTLTMGVSGEITNAGGDYSIDSDGFRVSATASYSSAKAYNIGGATPVGALWGDGSNIVLEARGTNALVLDSSVQITLDQNTVVSGDLTTDVGHQTDIEGDLNLHSAEDIFLLKSDGTTSIPVGRVNAVKGQLYLEAGIDHYTIRVRV